MIKKQYGKAVLIDEVTIASEALSKYINDEKLEVLGNPLPKPQDDLIGMLIILFSSLN